MTKIIVGLLTVLLLSTQIGCSKGIVPTATPTSEIPPAKPSPPAPVVNTAPPSVPVQGAPPAQDVGIQRPPPPGYGVSPFRADIVPEEVRYLQGQPVKVLLSVTNQISTPLILTRYPPRIWVTTMLNWDQRDQIIYSGANGTQTRELKQNETMSVNITWDQKDKDGNQVSPGWYSIFGDFSLNGFPGASVLIEYAQGAMEKTISLNQSQTANETKVTLERVEMNRDYSIFSFFVSRKALDTGWAGRGEYTIDGITKTLGRTGASLSNEGDGIRLTWAQLDPIPSDAKEITFTITRINDWTGAWVFKIPLR
mgnify:CR=1 FL=1